MTSGEKMRTLRIEKKLTQKQLGERLGISQSAVGQLENSKRPIRIDTLEKVSAALEVPIVRLYDDVMLSEWDKQYEDTEKYIFEMYREICSYLDTYAEDAISNVFEQETLRCISQKSGMLTNQREVDRFIEKYSNFFQSNAINQCHSSTDDASNNNP